MVQRRKQQQKGAFLGTLLRVGLPIISSLLGGSPQQGQARRRMNKMATNKMMGMARTQTMEQAIRNNKQLRMLNL